MKRSNAWVRVLERGLSPGLRRLAGQPHRGPAPEPARVLICKTCCLGDAVLSLYAIRAFKQSYPQTRLEILGTERIREVYADAPWIDAVHVLPVTGRRLAAELLAPVFWLRLLRILWRLRRQHFDWLVDLELYRGYGPALKRLLGIPFARGFHVEGLPAPPHDAVFFRGRRDPEWRGFFGVFALPLPAEAPAPLYARPLPETGAARRVGVVFGSSFNWPEKKWPLDRYAAVLSRLAAPDLEFVLFGSAWEAPEAQTLLATARARVRSTAGALDFTGLKRTLAQCDLVFGNDTGALHLAAAAGVPTLVLFGPTSPEKWMPLGGTGLWLEDLACRPCYYLSSMPECSHHDCLRHLTVDRVADRLRELLSAPAPV